jgi:SNF2 family DNA or RNA helicase
VDDLPTAIEATPYILIDTQAKLGNGNSVQSIEITAQIVYGEPPIAKVINQSLERFTSTIPMRDVSEEDRLIGMYRQLKSSKHFPLNFSKEFTVDQIPQVLSVLDVLKLVEGITVAGFANTIQIKEEIQPEIDVSENDLSVDFQGAESNEIFTAWRNQQQYILLDNGALHQLPNEWLEENGHLVRELLLAKEQAGNRLPSFALFDLAQLCAKLNQPPPANLENLRVLTGDFDGIPNSELPDGLNATLRDYQREGYDWLSFLKSTKIGGILADDMGLGKTLQALCVLEHQSLVVAPTSVLHNWISETNKFRSNLSISLYHGTGRVFDETANVILTSYAILRNDIEKLEKINWKVVVLDEAQAIKNPKSLTAQSAFRLQSDFRLTLTGTPIENRLTELWSQIHFLCPGLLGGYADFIRQYEQPITEGEMNVAIRLRNKIKPFVLRRLKKDVAPELPPRSNQILYCTLSDTERNTYDAVRVATQQNIVRQLEEGTLNVMNALEALLRLRQAACHTGLLPGIDSETSSKVKTLVEKLEEVTNSGHKALVFSQWTSLLNLIEPHLESKDIGFVRLDGSTKDRQGVVEQFQNNDDIPIFLSSLKAGGTGLNLTEADHVFLVDPWWNPAVEDQAADRAHRIGQTKSVIVYKMVTKDTVEERILVLQDRKRQLAETALGGATQGASITKEDLLELLK